MCARDLAEAIRLVNATGYGLTSGLETLDDRQRDTWLRSLRAGNLYVNRSTTGAIVLRQPFGGMGKSAFGPGIKAGGPNYVAQLMRCRDVPTSTTSSRYPLDPQWAELIQRLEQVASNACQWPPEQIARLVAAIHSYTAAMADEFALMQDHFRLLGQDNFRRYLPVDELRVRIHRDDTCFEILGRVCAALVAGCRVTVSQPLRMQSPILEALEQWTENWGGRVEFVEESDDALVDVVRLKHTDRLRYAAPDRVPESVRRAVIEPGIFVADAPVLGQGRVELLWYLREQSVCVDYHRYGNLGLRANEPRAEPM
jgi:RHH-type proline utilization regulon transcriptional repressor/proline dehydrogenase/delta 1-pyrroline-5-carboxylate dehydrogenase